MYLFVSGLIGAVFDVRIDAQEARGRHIIAKIINTILTMEEASRDNTRQSLCSG